MNLSVEYWYPFPSSDNVTNLVFHMDAPLIGGGPGASPGGFNIWLVNPILMGGAPAAPAFIPVVLGSAVVTPGPSSLTAKYNNGRPYTPSGTTNFQYRFPLIHPVFGSTLPKTGGALTFSALQVVTPLYLTTGGANADMIPAGLQLAGANALADGAPAQGSSKGVSDPRLNHDSGQWQLEPGLGTIGNYNNNLNAALWALEGSNMYCRSGPMRTPAELGFIPTGNEWGTIDLCTEDASDVLSVLVADTNLWNEATGGAAAAWASDDVFYTNGTINPNTRSSNVLISAFVDLPTHEVPNVDTALIPAKPLDDTKMDVLRDLTDSIRQLTASGQLLTSFQAGNDWVRAPAMQQGGILQTAHQLNNNQRESLVRNTWGLFSPDDSLFTVVVIAQSINEAPPQVHATGIWDPNHDIVTGERRAVALVWRDPFKTGSNLHHEMFVRMFRYLND